MKPKELTLRGLILGALITTIFTAANVYLGLKVGLTFASSIPAAVISMAILSCVKDSSILENNIVQTVASAAGTLSAIIFVLPGLVIVGWWTGFPFWQSFLICVSGGVLGVLFTIPLRRALVTNSDLPYPEGVAAAEVLKVGSGTRGETKDDTGEAREGLRRRGPRHPRLGGARHPHRHAHRRRRRRAASSASARSASSGYNIAWSLALLGAGHLVGLSVGMAMLTGLVIAWVVAVPILTSMQPAADGVALAAHTHDDLAHAGAVHRRGRDRRRRDLHARHAREAGRRRSREHARRVARRGAHATTRDRDMSPPWIFGLTVVCLVIAGWLAFTFARSTRARAERDDADDDRRAVRAARSAS